MMSAAISSAGRPLGSAGSSHPALRWCQLPAQTNALLDFYADVRLTSCTCDSQVWVASLPSRYSEGKSHGQSAQLETCEEEQRRTLREKPGSGRWKTTIMITMTMSMISWNFPLVFLS
jgi:hypothetical protein